MIRKYLLAVCFIFVMAIPVTASAQTFNEQEYRAYLLSLIEILQQQIIALQAQVQQRQVPVTVVKNTSDDFESFLIEDEKDIEARYIIADESDVERIQNRTHREYFSRFFEVVPDQYDDYFIDLLVYEDRGNEFDGFVETVPPYRDDTWRIGLSEYVFEFSPRSSWIEELYVHEFAHVISYEVMSGYPETGANYCHEYYEEFGCPPNNSYLEDFSDRFWTEDDLDELIKTDGDLIWSNRELRDNFVTDYAGTNPAEDFAESFTFFVLEDRAEGSSVIDQKINYFYDFDHMVNLRSQIRSNL